MSIVLTCECGKKLSVKDELVGKSVRCPGCQEVLLVEGGDDPGPPARASIQPPGQRLRDVAPRGRSRDDDDDEEEAPRRRRIHDDDQRPPRRPPSSRLAIRILVLIFAIFGSMGAGFLGFKWWSDANANAALIALLDPEQVAKLNKLVYASYLLMGGALVGLAAAVLSFMRIQPLIMAILIMVAFVAPAPFAPLALIFSSSFLISGVLAFFVKAKPRGPMR